MTQASDGAYPIKETKLRRAHVSHAQVATTTPSPPSEEDFQLRGVPRYRRNHFNRQQKKKKTLMGRFLRHLRCVSTSHIDCLLDMTID